MAKPMSDARRAQLVAQIARARDAQAEKKKTAHVCATNDLDKAMNKLHAQLTKHAEGNTAPIPLAMNQEYLDGSLVWYVMIHVRLPRVTEYEVEAHADTLPDALSHAAYALGKQHLLRTAATRDGEVYGYAF
jgi:hypothetical protein